MAPAASAPAANCADVSRKSRRVVISTSQQIGRSLHNPEVDYNLGYLEATFPKPMARDPPTLALCETVIDFGRRVGQEKE